MILAIDAYYTGNRATVAGAIFNWQDNEPTELITATIEPIAEYVPGAFYKRELPCIMHLLEKVDLWQIDVIIIDGYVYVGNDRQPGLGWRLWDALNQKIPVIGVAKTSFHDTEQVTIRIVRGKNSTSPLFISAVGTELKAAAQLVRNMAGEFRIPSILHAVDKASRG